MHELRFHDDETTRTTVAWSDVGNTFDVDFWTVRCTRCPEALRHWDQLAKSDPSRVYVAGLLLQSSDAEEEECGVDLMRSLPHLRHVVLTYDEKEELKRTLRFQSVPFYATRTEGSWHVRA